jgi:uncharacterized membrane protein YccF (DUF307 family)
MKTRIIQREPDPEPAASEAESAVPARDERETWLRRSFFLVAVLGYVVLGAIHPFEIKVGDATTLYLGIHIVQPLFVLLLAWGVWLLVKDLPGRAAQIARIAIVPYAIAYSMLDAIAGISLGQIVREANEMSPVAAAEVQRAMNEGTDYIGFAIYAAAGLLWLAAAGGAAIALKQIGGLGPTLLMAVGAAIFAVGHPFPPGPIGIALFGLGIAWLEVRREAAKAPEAHHVLAP